MVCINCVDHRCDVLHWLLTCIYFSQISRLLFMAKTTRYRTCDLCVVFSLHIILGASRNPHRALQLIGRPTPRLFRIQRQTCKGDLGTSTSFCRVLKPYLNTSNVHPQWSSHWCNRATQYISFRH